MVLVCCAGLGTVQTERIGRVSAVRHVRQVGVVGQQVRVYQIVNPGCARLGVKAGFTGRIGGLGISREVVIKRNVFLENDNDVLDGGTGSVITVVIMVMVVGKGRCTGAKGQCRGAGK